jgi:hypothetical protein
MKGLVTPEPEAGPQSWNSLFGLPPPQVPRQPHHRVSAARETHYRAAAPLQLAIRQVPRLQIGHPAQGRPAHLCQYVLLAGVRNSCFR